VGVTFLNSYWPKPLEMIFLYKSISKKSSSETVIYKKSFLNRVESTSIFRNSSLAKIVFESQHSEMVLSKN
jgi:hypothetical protein